MKKTIVFLFVGCQSGCGNPIQSVSRCNLSPGDGYKFRCIYDVVDLPMDWPAEVNFLEAQAFCRWKGPLYRLPTEAEYSIINGDLPVNNSVECDPIHTLKKGMANVGFEYGSSTVKILLYFYYALLIFEIFTAHKLL